MNESILFYNISDLKLYKKNSLKKLSEVKDKNERIILKKKIIEEYKYQKSLLKKDIKERKKIATDLYNHDELMIFLSSFRKVNKKEKRRRAKKRFYKRLNEAPKLKVLEEIGNAVTHGFGALLGIIGLIIMLYYSTTPKMVVASLFYGISITIMMLMSCLYHAFRWGSTVKRIWRRFDYSSIYLLIGGTFSPLLLVNLGGVKGLIWFILMWLLIIVGITMVCIFGPGRLKWLHYPLYFILGWSALLIVPYWIKYYINLFYLILIGGVVYTIGMIPFLKRGVKGAHFIWHFFVLAGLIIHYIGIVIYIYL